MLRVTTKRLNEQVKRNRCRFPEDFIFQLNAEEARALDSLRSNFATLKKGRGIHRKYLPFVFTEHGAVMLACVLNSGTAVAASIHVVRAFNRLRQMASAHRELAGKLRELEARVKVHDESIRNLFEAIRELMAKPEEPEPPRPAIGFKPDP